MIKFLKMKEKDIGDVLCFLKDNDIYKKDFEKQFPFTFIIKREESILGLGSFSFINNKAIIKTSL